MLIELLLKSCQQHAERPAFRTAHGTVSYAELYRQVGAIRNQLLDAGQQGRSLAFVGINADPASVTTYAAILAAWSVGAAYVPLRDSLPPDRLQSMFDQVGLEVVVTERPWSSPVIAPATLVAATEGSIPEIWTDAVSSDDIAYLMFTSGSTGIPKGVPITVSNLEAFVQMFLGDGPFEYDPEDRFLQMFELSFDLSVMCFLVPLSLGASVCLVPREGVFYMNILKTLQQQQVTVALMVPSVLAYVSRFVDRMSFPALHSSLFCGEALLVDQLTAWRRCAPNARLLNVYGPTEATIFCTGAECHTTHLRSYNGIVEIGDAIGRTTVDVIDADGQPVATGERGELVLSGPQVMAGYWKNEEQTGRAFTASGAYRTGDIVFRDADGHLYYCGRTDGQVKVDGHRVELAEIEQACRKILGSAADIAASTYQPEPGIVRIALFVAGALDDPAAFEHALHQTIPSYMWPASVVPVTELPLNKNGKIDRKTLVSQHLSGASA